MMTPACLANLNDAYCAACTIASVVKKLSINRTHVDVPAFAFRSFDARQIAHRGLAGLHVGSHDRAHDELTLERIDSDLRIGNRTIAIRQPVDVCAEQLAPLIVSIDRTAGTTLPNRCR